MLLFKQINKGNNYMYLWSEMGFTFEHYIEIY